MKRWLTIVFVCVLVQTQGQNIGFGFSYLFPRGGSFSAPVSPISLRGVGFRLGPVMLESGIIWYRISGLGVQGLPFNYDEPITEPFNSFILPLTAGIEIGGKDLSFVPRIGAFYAINTLYNPREGSFSRGFERINPRYELVWTDTRLEQNNTFGLLTGIEAVLRVSDKIKIKLGTNYYLGASALNPSGSYTALLKDGTIERGTFEFPDTDLDFTGLEFTIGIAIKP